MRVLVTGDRHWYQKNIIHNRLATLPKDTVVIHGVARGVDQLAGECADELGFETEEYPADWKRYGRAAGPIRNHQMLNEGKPDLVLAFHDNLTASKGTRNMVTIATKAGVEVELFTSRPMA